MGFHLHFGKTNKMGKLINSYVSESKRKKAYEKQLTRLDAQLHTKAINQQVYERFRKLLEIKLVQAREEARAEIQHKF